MERLREGRQIVRPVLRIRDERLAQDHLERLRQVRHQVRGPSHAGAHVRAREQLVEDRAHREHAPAGVAFGALSLFRREARPIAREHGGRVRPVLHDLDEAGAGVADGGGVDVEALAVAVQLREVRAERDADRDRVLDVEGSTLRPARLDLGAERARHDG